MDGLALSQEMIATRESLYNPIRKHEPDGVVPPVLAEMVSQITPENVHTLVFEKPERVSVLTEAQGLVHGDRNAQYGAPAEEYRRTVGMVNAMLAAKLLVPLDPQDLAYIMVCLKLSRQVNKPKRDSLVDAAGYCEVAQWILDEAGESR